MKFAVPQKLHGNLQPIRVFRIVASVGLCLLTAFSLLLAQQAPEQPRITNAVPMNEPKSLPAAAGDSKMSPADAAAFAAAFAASPQEGAPLNVAMASFGGKSYAVFSAEFSSIGARLQFFRATNAQLLTWYNNFADFFLPEDADLDKISSFPGLVNIEQIGEGIVPPPPLGGIGLVTKQIAEPIIRGGLDGLTGKGVIIAVVDTGLDFRHPDFVTTDATGQPVSRLLYFWDTSSSDFQDKRGGLRAPMNYPGGASLGTLYSREQLTADLRSPVKRILDPDPNGHGTAATSVAAGNGRASNGTWKGVAPEADLIGVRIGNAKGQMKTYLLNAIVDWLHQVASQLDRPVVISCSFGAMYGAFDGNSVFERHLSARFAPDVTRTFLVIAAHNWRQIGVHAKLKVGGQSSPATLAWGEARNGARINIYVPRQFYTIFSPPDIRYDPMELTLTDSSGHATPVRTAILNVTPPWRHPTTGEWKITYTVGAGAGGMRIYSLSGKTFNADAYFESAPQTGSFIDSLGSPGGAIRIRFVGEQVSNPGTAANAITVGSYDFNDIFNGQPQQACGLPIQPGQLSCYSNPGYSRAGNVKPEITAPGEVYTSSSARLNSGAEAGAPETSTGTYRLFNGTSAATPYVAGVLTLALQKNPKLTVGEMRRLLQQSATADANTGAVPNPDWGYGKLDVAAVRKLLSAIPRAAAPTRLQELQLSPTKQPPAKSGASRPNN